ncbi:MAG: SDR family NAD(P)-dependent oxidoreductase, partial [Acidobacteria bacterium]|nr:SDR family NAD(P)-dependent oxidoreductase [Acidobacteriota bacterium]
LSAARREIEGAGPGTVETLQADVKNYADMARAVDAAVARFGGLDFLINNAGIGLFGEVAETVIHLLRHPRRSLPSRVELRPSKPRK